MRPVPSLLLLLPLAATVCSLTLRSSLLTVEVDDRFPRALNYSLGSTGETLRGALEGWGFHLSLTVNGGQVSCGEAGIATAYTPVGGASAAFAVTAACALNWGPGAPAAVLLHINGSIAVVDDDAVVGAAAYTWLLESAELAGAAVAVTTLTVVGLEALSLHPVPLATRPECMYTPTMNGRVPACGGDTYYVDAWANGAVDEWASGTWGAATLTAAVDVNTPAGGNAACLDGAASRAAPGPLSSVVAGGWSASGRTGAGVLSSEKHLPFWSGLRAYDLPGRCSVFTVAPAPIHAAYACGPGLPYALTVGVFPDVTGDGAVGSDDLHLWRRMQFPRADTLYRTSLVYKLQIDLTSYNAGWSRLPFVGALDYVANLSRISDAYPQVPILVGWQGIGHDTLYPGWDVVNTHPDTGGAAGLAALAAGLEGAAGNGRSSLSYHVNADEAYSRFAGAPNAEFDAGACRLNADHASVWAMNCSAVNFQVVDCGLRCSLSKTKDNVAHGRYARYGRIFDTVPPGLRTIHSDAWRDVGASWEPEAAGGFIDWSNEQRCGQQADAAFWAARGGGVSMGCEGNDGQPAELMGTVSFLLHAGDDAWSTQYWGRLVTGGALGFEGDVYCNNPGGSCGWVTWANSFYLAARLYQLAATDELLGTDAAAGTHRFARGGRVQVRHTKMHLRSRSQRGLVPADGASSATAPADVPRPSTWPYGGDDIDVANDAGGVLLPLVTPDGGDLVPRVLHAYQLATRPPPDADCPLYSPDPALYTGANNTALGSWASGAYAAVELDPALPEAAVVAACNASCWANATGCGAWDLIKVTPSSGKTKPLCSLYTAAAAAGCEADPNQWAGARRPLPVPPPEGLVNQTWRLPLSWVGAPVTAVALTPEGAVPGKPGLVVIAGRSLSLVGVQPGVALRLTVPPPAAVEQP